MGDHGLEPSARRLKIAVAIHSIRRAVKGERRALHPLLHYVYHAIVMRRRLHAAIVVEFVEGFRLRRLVRSALMPASQLLHLQSIWPYLESEPRRFHRWQRLHLTRGQRQLHVDAITQLPFIALYEFARNYGSR